MYRWMIINHIHSTDVQALVLLLQYHEFCKLGSVTDRLHSGLCCRLQALLNSSYSIPVNQQNVFKSKTHTLLFTQPEHSFFCCLERSEKKKT